MNESYENIRVLVVEDEDALRQVVANALLRRGFQVETAASGRSALSVLEERTFDVIVSDIRMPDGDGLFLLDELRKKQTPHPALIFMTGYSDIGEEDCLKRGATSVILKPFSREKLLAVVQNALGLPKS